MQAPHDHRPASGTVAERIEDDVQAGRIEPSVSPMWKTGAALLACIGPQAGAEHVVRSAARLAVQLNAEWHAIYVETPQLQRLPSDASRTHPEDTETGREILARRPPCWPDNDIARAIVGYARSQNFSKVVLGRSHPTWPWRKPHLKRIAAYAPDIDLIEIGRADPEPPAMRSKATAGAVDALPSEAEADSRSLNATVAPTGATCWAAGASLSTAADRDAAAALPRPGQHRDAVPADRGAGRGALRARAGGDGDARGRGALRFLLRAAALYLCGQRCAIPGDVRRDAGGRPDHRPSDGRPALSGARRIASRDRVRARCTNSRANCPAPCRPNRCSRSPALSLQRTFRAKATLLLPDDARPLAAARRCAGECASCRHERARHWASRNGHSTTRRRPASAPTRCRAAASSICRWWRRCARAACWPSSRKAGAGS